MIVLSSAQLAWKTILFSIWLFLFFPLFFYLFCEGVHLVKGFNGMFYQLKNICIFWLERNWVEFLIVLHTPVSLYTSLCEKGNLSFTYSSGELQRGNQKKVENLRHFLPVAGWSWKIWQRICIRYTPQLRKRRKENSKSLSTSLNFGIS